MNVHRITVYVHGGGKTAGLLLSIKHFLFLHFSSPLFELLILFLEILVCKIVARYYADNLDVTM